MKSSIILAAGLGKRVREYSLDLPKPLIEVNGKPFIEYSINIMAVSYTHLTLPTMDSV